MLVGGGISDRRVGQERGAIREIRERTISLSVSPSVWRAVEQRYESPLVTGTGRGGGLETSGKAGIEGEAGEVPPGGGAGASAPRNGTDVAAGPVMLAANCVGGAGEGTTRAGTSGPDRGMGICAEIFRGGARSERGVGAPWELICRDGRDNIV